MPWEGDVGGGREIMRKVRGVMLEERKGNYEESKRGRWWILELGFLLL